MKWYWEILKNYKKYIIISPMLVLIFVICETVQPTLMAKVVDEGVMKGDLSLVMKTGGVMILFSVISLLTNIANVYYSSRTGVGFATDLRQKMFRRIQQYSFSDIDFLNPASLITRMTNDTTIIQQVLMMSMRLLIRAPLMILFAFFFIIRINSHIAGIIGLAVPVLAVCIYLLLRKGFPLFMLVQQKIDSLNAVVRENLINIRVVKSFVREPFEKKKFARSNTDLQDTVIKASNVVIMIMPVMQLIMNTLVISILWVGGIRVAENKLQVGELISFVNYSMQILMALMLVSMTLMMFARASASSKRILEVLNKEPSLKDTGKTSPEIKEGKIAFRNVCFKYDRESSIDTLKNINFELKTGEFAVLTGPTGSGKTTLLQLIPRLYDVSEGEITMDGIDIKEYSLTELRHSVGISLQKDKLFSGTILSNLKWGNPEASREEIIKMSKAAEAHEFIMSFPEGYDTVVEQEGVNLSGGQRQRICIARALLKKPKVLILDDSTGAVDTDTEKRIWENLRALLYGTTVLVVTQRIGLMQAADRVILLEDGTVGAMGTHSELLETSPAYREIYRSQLLLI